MFSSKVCLWLVHAILVAIFISQPFFQTAYGNEDIANIVKDFTGKVVKLNKPDSHKINATGVVKNVEKTLLKILVSDCDKLRQFLVAYKHFLHSAKKHYVSPNYIEDCDKQITIFEKNLPKNIEGFLKFDDIPTILYYFGIITDDIRAKNPKTIEIETLDLIKAINEFFSPILQRMKHIEDWRMSRLDANGLPDYWDQFALAEWAQKNKWSMTKAEETGMSLPEYFAQLVFTEWAQPQNKKLSQPNADQIGMAKSALGHSPKAAASSSNNVGEKMKKGHGKTAGLG